MADSVISTVASKYRRLKNCLSVKKNAFEIVLGMVEIIRGNSLLLLETKSNRKERCKSMKLGWEDMAQ